MEAMKSVYATMILLLPKHVETCPYKGKKAFFGNFSTFDHIGYSKKILLEDFFLLDTPFKS